MTKEQKLERDERKASLLEMLKIGIEPSILHPKSVFLTGRQLSSLGNELKREGKARWDGPFLKLAEKQAV